MKNFASIVKHKIFDYEKHGLIVVIAGAHFAERLIDRDLNHELATKILSYVFETYPEKFLSTVDTFINYKDIVLLVNSVKKDGICKIRMNTMLRKDEETWFVSKNEVPVQHIHVELKEILNFVPKTLEGKKQRYA